MYAQINQRNELFRDEDMQSMASLMSVNNNSDDIAALEDVEDEDYSLSDSAMKNSIHEVTQHLQQMTNSLSGSDFASTPISGKLIVRYSNDKYYKNLEFTIL